MGIAVVVVVVVLAVLGAIVAVIISKRKLSEEPEYSSSSGFEVLQDLDSTLSSTCGKDTELAPLEAAKQHAIEQRDWEKAEAIKSQIDDIQHSQLDMASEPAAEDDMDLYWTAYSHAKSGDHVSMTAALSQLDRKRMTALLARTHGSNPTTMLHTAAYNGHLECVRDLIKLGAPSNIENCYGELPVDCAHESGNGDVVALLRAQE